MTIERDDEILEDTEQSLRASAVGGFAALGTAALSGSVVVASVVLWGFPACVPEELFALGCFAAVGGLAVAVGSIAANAANNQWPETEGDSDASTNLDWGGAGAAVDDEQEATSASTGIAA